MGDKALIAVFILFIAVGVAAYDQHLAEKGEVGPVGQLLDFAGLGEHKDFLDFRMLVTKKSRRFNLQDSLSQLQVKHLQIEEQREQLVQNRRVILEKLLTLNQDIGAEAQQYSAAIDQERADFLKNFPMIEQLGQSIANNVRESDPQVRQENYQRLQFQLQTLLKEMISSVPEKQPDLNGLLKKFDNLDGEVPAIDKTCQADEQCLNQHVRETVEDVKSQLTAWNEAGIQEREVDVAEIIELSELLQKEYDSFIENQDATQERIDAGNNGIATEMKNLTEKLVDVTEKDLRQLMDLYEEFAEEQEILIGNFELSLKRLYDTQNQVIGVFGEITEEWRNSASRNNRFVQHLGILTGHQQKLLASLNQENKEMLRSMRDHDLANRDFLLQLTKIKDPYLAKLLESRKYTETKNNNNIDVDGRDLRGIPSNISMDQQALQRSHELKNMNTTNLDNTFTTKTQGMIDRSKERDKYHTSTNQQYERMKEKAN